METVVPACPVCASSEVRTYTRKNDCTVYVCQTCRYRFVYPLPDVAAVYGESYFTGGQEGFGYADYDHDKEPMIPAFKRYLALIRKYAPYATRLLDVGAATGFFVSLAEDTDFEAAGVELSSFAVQEGVRQGRNVRVGTIHDLSPTEHGAYDVVTMLDVLEHVPDPEGDIVAARTLLSPGGLLVINTPDTGSAYARMLGTYWHLITPPEHIAYFDRKNLTTVLERNGFDVVWAGTIGKQFTLPYIFTTLYTWQGWSLWRTLAEWTRMGFLSRLMVPINLRDNMFILARAHEA